MPPESTPRTARYSFLGTAPYRILRSKGSRVEVVEGGETTVLEGDPFKILAPYVPEVSDPPKENAPSHLPFLGGIVGYFGYDLVRFIEAIPRQAVDDLALPDMILLFVDTVVALDHLERKGWILVSPRIPGPHSPPLEEGDPETRLDAIAARLRAPAPPLPETRPPADPPPLRTNMTRDNYLRMVARCQEFIAAGEIYQANLSQRLSLPLEGRSPLGLYGTLREINPSPFSALLELGDLALVSSSPERLVRLSGREVETRPIAGTRPRGENRLEETRLRRELLTNEKERAEHLMLVDLERNDLGRVCETGSVCVDEIMTLESYSHVTHIVSNIRGRLLPGKTPLDLLRAVFPGGTVTGVPKIRCMEIIDGLEPTSRGPYTGAIGYIDLAGRMDLNIIIRTLVLADGWAHAQVGGGIVADSDPEREYQETLYKAEALLRTLHSS